MSIQTCRGQNDKNMTTDNKIDDIVYNNEQKSLLKDWDGDYYFKAKVESIESEEQIEMKYFISIDNKKATLSIGTERPIEAYCEGDYSVLQKNGFIHLIHTGETGICTSNIEDSSFDIKKEGDKYYIRSKRFINFDWQECQKNSL